MQLTNTESITIPRHFKNKKSLPVAIAMLAVADFLIFRQAPGLNLFLFSISLTATVLIAAHRQPNLIKASAYMGFSALAAAPLLEAPSFNGFILAIAANVVVALANAKLLPKKLIAIPLTLLRFIPAIPMRLPQALHRYFASHSGQAIFGTTLKSLAGWMLPLGMGLVFLLLFSAANPLIEMGLHNIDLRFLLNLLDIERLGFWLVAAICIWPVMYPRLMRKFRRRTSHASTASSQFNGFLDHTALIRCLSVFNLLFAMQTMLDVLYLWGGAELPAGMSHAEYAHRGAYPLVATALLAAAFVLLAVRRGGPGDRSRSIRILVLAWIVQNVMLCLSSILRLDLYVETYSLTGLRMAAGIWMGLVAAGLVFILLRIALRRSNEWLISMNLVTLASVLYLVALFDTSSFIARFNVENSAELGQQGTPLDIYYLTSLGPSAIPALDVYLTRMSACNWKHQMAKDARAVLVGKVAARSKDWRSWSYRGHRIENYIQSTALIER